MKAGYVIMRRKGANRWAVALLALAMAWAGPAWADKIITVNGQTLEGVIQSENQFGVRLDNRGNIISVPRARIRSIVRQNLDENVRMLLGRAGEALERSDIAGARTYVEQAKTLNTPNPTIQTDIEKLNKQILEMEVRGGTPEERRMRADALLNRAKEAYDMIRTEEGNNLLLSALITDPSYDRAHQMIGERLVTRIGKPQAKPEDGLPAMAANAGATQQQVVNTSDLLLAASYFTQVMWPDNVREDSPVIKMLPRIYAGLAQLFAESSDADRSKNYALMMKKIADAFAAHPTWKESEDEKVKPLLEPPVETLLGQIIKESVDKKNYELSLRKLKGMVAPDATADNGVLYLRAHVGAGQFNEALALLDILKQKFPDETRLQPQYNALKLLMQGMDVERVNKTTAMQLYDKIYETRENLLPEIVDTTGRRLADLKGADMDLAMGSNQLARAADIAAVVMQYGQDSNLKRRAAQIMIMTLQKLPWKFDLVWQINGTRVQLDKETVKGAAEKLRPVLAVTFDENSPFTIRLVVNSITAAPTQEVVQAISNNQDLAKPAIVTAFQFSLDAVHSTLGTIYHTQWKSSDVPKAASYFDVSPAPAPAAPAATPTPNPEGGAPPAEGAPPPDAGAATPTPTPTPTPKPTPKPGIDKNALLSIERVFINPKMGKRWSFDVFIAMETGFLPYIQNWQGVTLLPSHLSVPLAREILTQ